MQDSRTITLAPQQDALERDRAMTDDAALVAYHRKWQRRLASLQRSYPERWHVAGLSAEEVRDALTLRLIEVVRGAREDHAAYDEERKDWGLAVMQKHLLVLRRSFRLAATPVDFSEDVAIERQPSQEERLLELEDHACHELAAEQARGRLSRPQRRWFAALRLAANCDQFFAASDELNLSAASRVLQKHRSSALRAFRELQTQFRRELERLR